MGDNKFCIKCGKSILTSADFCPFCGSVQTSIPTEDNTVSDTSTYKDYLLSWYRKAFTIDSVDSRKEFWIPYIFNMLIVFILYLLFIPLNIAGSSSSQNVTGFHIFVACVILYFGFILAWGVWAGIGQITSCVRRLHDTNKSSLFWFIGLIPIIGTVILIYLLLQPSVTTDNKYLN